MTKYYSITFLSFFIKRIPWSFNSAGASDSLLTTEKNNLASNIPSTKSPIEN